MNKQTVLITGTSTGLGNVVARALAQQGNTVYASMRNVNGKKAATEDHNLHILQLDVCDETSIETAVQEVMKREGRLDVLINNAGVGGSGYSEAFSTKQFQQIFDVNVFGVQRMMRAVLPIMRNQHSGLIINVSSSMGRIVIPFSAAYTASKYALEALVESYHYELAPIGIDVVIVEPGGFASDYWVKMTPPDDKERAAAYGLHAETPDKLWSGISTMMRSEQAPPPQVVSDAIVQLIETPTGSRPLRTVVDPATGGTVPTAINQMTEKIQNQLLESFGLKDLLSIRPK